jgi:PQQ enzyme repeat
MIRRPMLVAGIAMILLASLWAAPVQAAPTATRPSATKSAVPAATANANWLTYHNDNSRAGYDPNEPSFSQLRPAWTQSSLIGDIYASPLVYGGTVYVATEDNYIYALDANNKGTVLWSVQLSTPMPSTSLPCGNISPHVGITGTPVIDTSTNRIFAVGNVMGGHYVLWGVNLTTHNIDVNVVVDPGSVDLTYAEGQRGALALSQGVVYIPFGGRAGDCNSPMGLPYHGVVLGASASTGARLYNFTTNGGQSGIWAPGGESVDASGNVWVATGNGFGPVGGAPSDSERVIRLNPNLSVSSSWVPANQSQLDGSDADVGSIIPGLVGGGDIFQSGKTGDSYLLDSTLGQAQGPTHVCTGLSSDASFGATAYLAPYIYVPCENGLFAVTQSGNTFSLAWSFPGVHATSPIIAGGAVLVLDGGGSTLYAINPTTGAQITSVSTGSLTHFASPATGDGMVFVPAQGEIDAFSMGGCTSASMSPSVASPQGPGATVTFTATATMCMAPEFKFFLDPPDGSWTAQAGFGGATWAWNTTGLKAGVYQVGVWARQTGSGASYEAYWIGTYTLSVTTCNAATLSTATSSPQAPGAMITFNATATRCPGAQFRFWMMPHGGGWTIQRDYGAASWTWNTTGLAPGTYELGVWARQPGSTNSYDAYGFTTFALGSGNCISAGLAPNLATPQAPGATVIFTASSNSCTSPLYQFWLLPPGGGWTVKQSYSATTTWSWNTSGMPIGPYQVGVWAKASASTASYDAFFIGTYQLDVSPCTSASISASPASPQAAGTTITFTAGSTDCTAPRYEFWKLPPPGTAWSVTQPYGTATTFSWNTTGLAPGPYRIGVWARQNGSTSSYDSYAILTFWVG